MARNAEEEYLNQLLQNAMMQDARLEDTPEQNYNFNESDNSDDTTELSSAEMAVSTMEDEVSSDFDASEDAEGSSQEEILNQEEIESLNELIKSVSEESVALEYNSWDDTEAESYGDEAFSEPMSIEVPEIRPLEENAIPDLYDEPETPVKIEDTPILQDESLNEQAESQDNGLSFMDNIKNIVENAYEIEAVPERQFNDPVASFDDMSFEELTASLNPADNSNFNSFSEAPDEQPTDTDEFSDILALDEGMSFDDIPDEVENPLSAEEQAQVMSMTSFDEPNLSEEAEETAEDKKSKKKKKKDKKAKKEKKKFSLKNFFIDYEDEDEEAKNNEADLNQKLIDELYNDTDSLADAEVDKDGKKVKAKKEKKPKKEKVKKVKPPKEPKEKVDDPKGKIGFGAIFLGILFAVAIAVIIIFGNKLLTYRRVINAANNYYKAGNYGMAYSTIDGIDVNGADKPLYMKIRTVMLVYQGIESYTTYSSFGDQVNALDALIRAAANKQKADADAIKYEVTDEVNQMYNRVLSLLDKYGIDESKALELYSMTNYADYRKALSGYGGIVSDSSN